MTTPPILQLYNLAQSFFLDAEPLKGAKKVGISSIELFFKQKPQASGNKSGIQDPGVSVFIVETDADKKPLIDPVVTGTSTYDIARVEYENIQTSSDASRPTKFKFDDPIEVETNKEYCLIVRFDGNEDFILWSSKQNDLLLGTNKPSPGPSGKYTGNFYTAFAVTPGDPSQLVPAVMPTWKFSSDTDLKFRIYVARYSINGTPVVSATLGANVEINSGTAGSNNANIVYGANSTQFHLATGYYEYIVYEKKKSKPKVKGGEWVYQNTVFYPGGSANPVTVNVVRGSDLITANSQWPNGQSFNWNSVYGSSNNEEYIVLLSLNDDNAGERRTDIKKIVSVESNTVLRVDSGMNFTNSAAYFIKSPVAQVDFLDKSKSFDLRYKIDNKQKKRTKQDLLVLNHSNANASHRFVNNTLNSVSISVAGGGYNNNEVLYIYGYESVANAIQGGYPAIANIVTNGSGNITAIHLSNVGAGFVNTANVMFTVVNNSTTSVSNATSNTANGSGATFTVTEGTVLRAEFDGDDRKGGFFTNCDIINIEISDVIPSANVNNPAGTKYDVLYNNPFFVVQDSNTHLGVTYYIDGDVNRNRKLVKLFDKNGLPYKNTPVLPSRSNEFIIVNANTGNPVVNPPRPNTTINAVSNNDFVCIQPKDLVLTYSRFNINNDYSGENTNYGNADSKHITTKVNFANGRFAEDLLVYLTAYRPLNTDIKVFARIHNSKDTEAFDDKDWTMLELTDGDIYSSSADSSDYIEMTFGFQKHPNVAISLTGSVNVQNSTTTNVIGSGTTFSSNAIAKLLVNDVVKIYPPLFPDNYSISVVTAVDSDTQFSINKPIANLDIQGSGLKVELIGRVGNSTVSGLGYPLQAFNNQLNDNVVRYYNSSMIEFDTYDSMQLKIVLLSDLAQVGNATANVIPTTVPRVDDIRAIGVTA
jgi:hypothetical protein